MATMSGGGSPQTREYKNSSQIDFDYAWNKYWPGVERSGKTKAYKELTAGVRYHTAPYGDAASSPAAAKKSGGGSRSGGGGGRSGRSSLNLKVYRPGKYSDRTSRKRANTMRDSWYNESLSGTRMQREGAESRYEAAMRELALNQQRDERMNREALASALAQNNNVALNRGMGYGQGFQSTQANTNLASQRTLNDLLDQYLVQSQNVRGERDLIYTQADEADRLAAQQGDAKWLEFFLGLDNNAFNRYLGAEGLAQAGIGSQNDAIRARAGL